MEVLVTDANIFIDLLELEIIELLFLLEFEIHTTNEVFSELDNDQQVILTQTGGLIIRSFSEDEVDQIQSSDIPRSLSFSDKTAIFLAMNLNAVLLTGDGKMRSYASQKNMNVRGILWFFDTCIELNVLSERDGAILLEKLISINSRLPLKEVEARIRKWK